MTTIQPGIDQYELMKQLFPICRSITGDGVRETLKVLQEYIPLDIHEVASGTKVFDWTVPKEWVVRDAYIKNSAGQRVVDFNKSNLHVLNYSAPVKGMFSLADLRDHLFICKDNSEAIPYLTTYYHENWGFCISQNQLNGLEEDNYEVMIDSEFIDGSLSYGELFIEGESSDEVLFSTYTCHPSLCNDNLSGVVMLTFLAKKLLGVSRRYSYRFLFIPETIGSIAWLALNQDKISNIKHGLVATCVGDPGNPTYKRSRQGNAEIDIAVEKVLRDSDNDYSVLDFWPLGSDERQFCSPGFDLPVGSLMRTVYGHFPEYHTSDDNLDFVQPESLHDSLEKYLQVVEVLENNVKYVNVNPYGEPQLGKRGIYQEIGGAAANRDLQSILWVLNLSDGSQPLLDIAIRSNMNFKNILSAARLLESHGLINEIS